MAAAGGRGAEWLPTGFPPRSFPLVGAPPPPPPPHPRPPRRGIPGWWMAGGAGVLALVLLAAVLLATRGGGGDRVTTGAGSTTSVADTSLPTFEATTTFAPNASIDPVTTAGTVATTAPSGGTGPTVGGTSAPAGVLEVSATSLVLPKADAAAGVSQAPLTLRNTGPNALTYTTLSTSAGLNANPARGTINPGASTTVMVSLDASRVGGEGPFTGTLSFGGTGGGKAVQVQSTVGRAPDIFDNVGEACAPPTATCSRQIKLAPSSAPDASPCNTAWLYSVTISDQSQIQSARSIARRGVANADAPLRRGGNSDIFQSDPFGALGPGTVLRFALEAVDQFGFGRRLAEQTITC